MTEILPGILFWFSPGISPAILGTLPGKSPRIPPRVTTEFFVCIPLEIPIQDYAGDTSETFCYDFFRNSAIYIDVAREMGGSRDA